MKTVSIKTGLLSSHLVKGVSGSFGLKVLFTLLSFVATVFLSRILGAAGFGYYTYALSWVTLLSIPATLGVNELLSREIPRLRARGAWSELLGILQWADRAVLAASLTVTLVAATVLFVLGDRLEQEMFESLLAAMLLLPCLSFLGIRQGAGRGFGDIVRAQLPQLLFRPVLFILCIGLFPFFIQFNAQVAVSIRVLCAAAAMLLSFVQLQRRLPEQVKDARPRLHSRLWLKSGICLSAGITASIVNEQLSVILVGSILGARETGLYEVARRGAVLITFFPTAMGLTIGPTVARLYAGGQKERLQSLVSRSVFVNTLSAAFIWALLIVFGHWYLRMFGEEFLQAGKILLILSSAACIQVGLGPTSLFLNMTGNERYTFVGLMLGLLSNALLTIFFIRAWGLEGVAWAQLINIMLYKSLLSVFLYKATGINATCWKGMRRWSLSQEDETLS